MGFFKTDISKIFLAIQLINHYILVCDFFCNMHTISAMYKAVTVINLSEFTKFMYYTPSSLHNLSISFYHNIFLNS